MNKKQPRKPLSDALARDFVYGTGGEKVSPAVTSEPIATVEVSEPVPTPAPTPEPTPKPTSEPMPEPTPQQQPTIMDKLQYKTKHEEHNCSNALAKPTEPTELANSCLEDKKGHLQKELHMNMKTWQGQERTKGSLPTATKQNRGNRRLDLIPQAAEQAEH